MMPPMAPSGFRRVPRRRRPAAAAAAAGQIEAGPSERGCRLTRLLDPRLSPVLLHFALGYVHVWCRQWTAGAKLRLRHSSLPR